MKWPRKKNPKAYLSLNIMIVKNLSFQSLYDFNWDNTHLYLLLIWKQESISSNAENICMSSVVIWKSPLYVDSITAKLQYSASL